ncbi:MAG: hypothetical protein ABID63_18210 [Pseudomonadota bacterium]
MAVIVHESQVFFPPPTPVTAENIRREIALHINSVARLKGYDDGEDLSAYVNSTKALWRAEAMAFVAWRDGVLTYAQDQIDLWIAEGREISTADELVGELDEIEWPATDGYLPLSVVQSVLLSFTVVDGEIGAVTVTSGALFVWRIDVGEYWVFFAKAEPDTHYVVFCSDGGAVRVFAPPDLKDTGYCVVKVTDNAGVATDPAQLTVEIKRAL